MFTVYLEFYTGTTVIDQMKKKKFFLLNSGTKISAKSFICYTK